MIRITVLYSPAPRQVLERRLQLPEGATVADALRLCDLGRLAADTELTQAAVGIWGRKAQPQQRLREGDRVEIYRPLRVDPKVARRERFRKQGTRAAGLFAKRRPGGKPGY